MARFEAMADANHEHIEHYGRDVAPTAFAGSHQDSDERVIWVGFTETADLHLAKLKERVPHPQILRTFDAKRSRADLMALLERITEDDLEGLGLTMTTLGPDVCKNCLRLGVDPAPTDQQVRDIDRRYAGAVVVEHAIVAAASG